MMALERCEIGCAAYAARDLLQPCDGGRRIVSNHSGAVFEVFPADRGCVSQIGDVGFGILL